MGARVLLLEAAARIAPVHPHPTRLGLMHKRRMFDWAMTAARPHLNGRRIEAMRGKVLAAAHRST